MNFYQFEPILIFCLFMWVFYLHGAFISQKLQLNQVGVHRLFINLSIGFALVIFLLFFIALFHLLTPVFVGFFFLIIPFYYFVEKVKNKNFNINSTVFFKGLINHAWLIFVILYLVFPDTYNIFFPETSSDAMRYHLPYARFYVENHGLAVNEFLRYPVFSHNFDMVFSLGYLFLGNIQGEVLARLFSLFSFVLLVLGLYSLTLRSFNKTTAVIAIVILVKAKIFRTLMISGYIDIGLTLFLFTCVYFLYLWQQEKKNKWLYLSACLLGVVLGTKYLGLLWLIPLTVWVFFTNKNWKNTYQYFLIALVVGSPWYIRNIVIAGNPLHPFLQDVFGYWLWTPADIIGQKKDLLINHGVERNFINFIKLPYLLETLHYFSKYHLGWLMVLGIPFLTISIKMPRFFKHLAFFTVFNLLFWFYTSQIVRYLLPTLTFLALFAAYPLGKLLNPIVFYDKFQQKYVVLVLSLGLIVYGTRHISHLFQVLDKWKPLPHTTIDWGAYNEKQNKYYSFVKILNIRKAKRVFNISDAMMQNTFNGLVLGDWFGVANKRKIYKFSHSEREIIAILSQFDTSYLLVDKQKFWYNNVNEILTHSSQAEIILETDDTILYFFKNLYSNKPKVLLNDF